MQIKIKELRKKDYNKAIEFAIKGMHFDWYMSSKLLLNLYGRYFWYLSMTRATQIIAAYIEDNFAGVLLAEMKDEKRKYHSFWKSLYVRIFNIIQNVFVKEGVGIYDQTNKELFSQYCQTNSPDGEIIFLAANPDIKIKGIGSFLLEQFENREKNKKIYLYTDDACTYQFYEHRGFDRASEKDIILHIGKKRVNLKCFLYSKIIV